MITTAQHEASRPKMFAVYSKAGFCPKHKSTRLWKVEHECCDCCCDGCDPEYTCPRCEALYDKKVVAWLRKFCHMVAVGDCLLVKDGKLQAMNGVVFQQYLHGGNPLKIGSWCKIGADGYLKRSTKNNRPQMLVIS